MKPHEEEWLQASDGTTVDCGGGCVLVQMRPAGQAQRPGVARLASAAPDMARALEKADHELALHGYAPDSIIRERIRAALAKAGVLP